MISDVPFSVMLHRQRSADVDAQHSTLLTTTARSGRVGDQIAQHRQEVRHRLASARFATLDCTDRDALLGHSSGLLDKLSKSPTAKTRRPPHVHGGPDRGLDIVGTEGQRCTAYASLDLILEARRSLGLPSTHLPHDTPEGGAEPLPQTLTQRPTGARLS